MNCFSSPFQLGKKGRQRSLGTFLLSRGGRLCYKTRNDGNFSCCSEKLIEGHLCGAGAMPQGDAGLGFLWRSRGGFVLPFLLPAQSRHARGFPGNASISWALLLEAGTESPPRAELHCGALSSAAPGDVDFSKCFLGALWLGRARLLVQLSKGWDEAVPLLP